MKTRLRAVLLVLLFLAAPGCSSPPVPLAPTFAQSNDVGARLDKRNRDHEAAIQRELVGLVRAGCAPREKDPDEFERCARAVTARVAGSAFFRDTLLQALTGWHRDAVEALRVAQQCRQQGDEACAERQRALAVDALARVEANLKEKP